MHKDIDYIMYWYKIVYRNKIAGNLRNFTWKRNKLREKKTLYEKRKNKLAWIKRKIFYEKAHFQEYT